MIRACRAIFPAVGDVGGGGEALRKMLVFAEREVLLKWQRQIARGLFRRRHFELLICEPSLILTRFRRLSHASAPTRELSGFGVRILGLRSL